MEYPGATRGVALAALLADLTLGEPPDRLHPTVWMGRWLGRMRDREKQRAGTSHDTTNRAFGHGVLTLSGGLLLTTVVSGASALLLNAIGTRGFASVSDLPARLTRIAAEGAALKPALAVRSLLRAADVVRAALESDDMHEARRLLAWHLVSRPTHDLAPHEIAGATIASLAENLSDSVIAPLIAYRCAGLPGAYAYRFVNTADAMLGYRTAELEWFGKPSARTDDLLNLVPARISAPLIALVATGVSGLGLGTAWRALRCAMTEASHTASPNGGWPMAAMAGALGVRLEKRGHYVLNAEGRAPAAHDITRARRIVFAASLVAVLGIELSFPALA